MILLEKYKENIIGVFLVIVIFGIIYYLVTLLIEGILRILPPLLSSDITPFVPDIDKGLGAIIAGVGGYLVTREITRLMERTIFSDKRFSSIELLIRIFLYGVVIAIVLVALGINLEGALIGGAVGGVVIGLAVQNVASNVLSGLLATSGRAIYKGQNVILVSWIWSPPIVGKVEKVGGLYTDVRTPSGNIVKIPNSAFLGNTVFTSIDSESSLTYSTTLSVNADVRAEDLIKLAKKYIEDGISKYKAYVNVYFTSKNGAQNVFTVVIKFNDIDNFNEILNHINLSFDKAYWDLKK
ncbi:mechanosensitive ion channel protein MscS [Sulfolobales archaeon HS-7]|nr:mechanosensitive ion channel protein MscS [Sulfolobales archaeon HS-7]